MYILSKTVESFDYSSWINICHADGSALLVDKSQGWTSFNVVSKVRQLTGIKKIGHCGTLDPFATGLLILCLGKATKQIEQFQALGKQYLATIKLGATTKSLDIEYAEENVITDISYLHAEQIALTISEFIGKIEQIPPMFSAKKVSGRKLYELARAGTDISMKLKPSMVEILGIDIISIELPYVRIKVDCSKGTYIRALARDIGEKLGVGGYLTALERTRIGGFSVEDAFNTTELQDLFCTAS